ncbi:hypothetical protein [Stappia stellulata]|uniref:hypothetical protein n=1 Tax=Stappia stellulata TaxID=71235 RepID=UPI000420130D|nr:hypothetical protein [Stappia stellulata]
MPASGFVKLLAACAVLMPAGMTASALTATPASADSCWTHNGSLMRLKAAGSRRRFFYEAPRPVLRDAGVTAGTMLFEGTKRGNRYKGTARVFSRSCPGQPQVYAVEGPVRADQLQVTLSGRRNVNRQCHPTDRVITDTLVFTYAHRC